MEYIYGFKSCARRANEFRDKIPKMGLWKVDDPQNIETPYYFVMETRKFGGPDVKQYFEANDVSIREYQKAHNCIGTGSRFDTIYDFRNPEATICITLFKTPHLVNDNQTKK